MSDNSVGDYRRKAAECLALAETSTPSLRVLWLEMAQDWESLAVSIEKSR